MDDETYRKWRMFAMGALAFVVLLMLAIVLEGCAGGSSSGNYHKTFRPASVVDSAE